MSDICQCVFSSQTTENICYYKPCKNDYCAQRNSRGDFEISICYLQSNFADCIDGNKNSL